MRHMKMESAERLPGLDRRGLRKRASARRRKRHRHLLLTQHLPNFGTESEIGVETMSGEWSLRGKGPARPNFSWEEFELAQRPTKSLLTPGTRHYDEPSSDTDLTVKLPGCYLLSTWSGSGHRDMLPTG